MSITYDARRRRSAVKSPSVAVWSLWALLLLWLAMTAGVVGVLVMLYLPGHAGLALMLQALNDFLANNPGALVAAGTP